MKLLLDENISLSNNKLNFKLMLDDEWELGRKKDLNKQDYILYITLPKGIKVQNNDIAENVQGVLYKYFLNRYEDKKALYIPKTYEISEYGEGFIDVYYNLEYKHPILDDGFKTDDDEIGKNLIWISSDDSTETSNIIKIKFKSIFLVDELYNIQTLWEIDNGIVYSFLLDELSAIMTALEE